MSLTEPLKLIDAENLGAVNICATYILRHALGRLPEGLGFGRGFVLEMSGSRATEPFGLSTTFCYRPPCSRLSDRAGELGLAVPDRFDGECEHHEADESATAQAHHARHLFFLAALELTVRIRGILSSNVRASRRSLP